MERSIIEEVAPYLGRMDAAALKSLAARLATLPQGGSLHAAIRTDTEFLTAWAIRNVKAADEGKLNEFLGVLASTAGGSDGQRKRIRDLAGNPPSRERVIKQLQELAPYYEEMANA